MSSPRMRSVSSEVAGFAEALYWPDSERAVQFPSRPSNGVRLPWVRLSGAPFGLPLQRKEMVEHAAFARYSAGDTLEKSRAQKISREQYPLRGDELQTRPSVR